MFSKTAGFVSRSTSNLSFIPTVSPAEDEHYAKIVNLKICVRIYNFKNGKGPNGIEVKANLDLIDFDWLCLWLIISMITKEKFNFYQTKIFGDPMVSGPYKGLCTATKMTITRTPEKSLWGISISNGYGKKIITKTGKVECAEGTYREEKKDFFSLTDKEMNHCLKCCELYKEMSAHQIAIIQGKLDEWAKAEAAERAQYKNSAQRQSQAPPAQASSAEVTPAQNAPVQAPQKPSGQKKYKIMIVSNFMKDQDGSVFCTIRQANGKESSLYFTKIPKGLVKNKEIEAPIIVKNRRYYWAV